MKTIEERAKELYPDAFDEDESLLVREGRIVKLQRTAYRMGATEQKTIDDAILAEIKRERDEYYDELLKLRQEKIDFEDKEKAFLNWIAQKKWWTEFGHEDKWEITYSIQEWFDNYKAVEE